MGSSNSSCEVSLLMNISIKLSYNASLCMNRARNPKMTSVRCIRSQRSTYLTLPTSSRTQPPANGLLGTFLQSIMNARNGRCINICKLSDLPSSADGRRRMVVLSANVNSSLIEGHLQNHRVSCSKWSAMTDSLARTRRLLRTAGTFNKYLAQLKERRSAARALARESSRRLYSMSCTPCSHSATTKLL